MNKKYKFKILALALFSLILSNCSKTIKEYSILNKVPLIFPDYINVVIPPNIAPLNFYINDSSKNYHVEIYSKNGTKLTIDQSSPKIEIPIEKWHNLIENNKGNNLYIDIFSKNKNWIKYNSIVDSIASEPVDSYLAYRLINNAYIFWKKMGIYQRNLENFDESPIYVNNTTKNGCVNCHSFCNGNPNKMSMHFRDVQAGTMIYSNNKLEKLNTITKQTISPFVYPSWHPSGNYVAYSTNRINLFFTSNPTSLSEVSDLISDIVVYDVRKNTIITSPKICTTSRENLPTWSPDGKWLYFISAPAVKKGNDNSRLNVKYSLLRISFEPTNNSWGNVDTVLSSRQTGMSITFPIISPDGRYLLFGMMDHGYFAVFDKNSDIYILDLQTKQYRKLELNSNSTDSYHVWSQNGRWIVFSSKRLDNIFSRPFFSYFDKNGKEHKPFLMPQEDPLFYDSFMKNYNRPELVTGKINLNPRQIRDLIYSPAKDVTFDSSNYENN
jgi:hypothetical protein